MGAALALVASPFWNANRTDTPGQWFRTRFSATFYTRNVVSAAWLALESVDDAVTTREPASSLVVVCVEGILFFGPLYLWEILIQETAILSGRTGAGWQGGVWKRKPQ